MGFRNSLNHVTAAGVRTCSWSAVTASVQVKVSVMITPRRISVIVSIGWSNVPIGLLAASGIRCPNCHRKSPCATQTSEGSHARENYRNYRTQGLVHGIALVLNSL